MFVVCSLGILGVVLVEVKQRGDLGWLGHARGLDQHVGELPPPGEGDDLVHQVGLQRAAETPVLHGDHLVALHQGRLVDQALVDVECGHVVHDDGAPEGRVLVLGLQDVLHHGRLARPQEPAQQGHGEEATITRITNSRFLILKHNYQTFGLFCVMTKTRGFRILPSFPALFD